MSCVKMNMMIAMAARIGFRIISGGRVGVVAGARGGGETGEKVDKTTGRIDKYMVYLL